MEPSNPKEKSKSRKTKKRHYNFFMVLGLLFFPFIAYFISPFAHEQFHILILKHYGCTYWTDYHASIELGISATIYKHCTLENNELLLLYLSGIAGTILIGMTLLIIDWYLTRRDYLELSIFTSFIAMGFLFSPMIYFFSETGDLTNAANLLSLSAEIQNLIFPLIGLSIIALSFLYFYLNLRHTEKKK